MAVWNLLDVLIPQLLLILFALLMPACDYVFRDKRVLAWLALTPLLAIAFALVAWLFLGAWEPPASDLQLIRLDEFSSLFMLVFISVGIVVVIGSPEFIRKDRNQGEYYALLLLAVTGMTVVAEATDLIALFVGLEIAGISSFALSGFRKTEKRSAEAATKYFIVGGFSSAVTLFAISLLYGVTGTTSISGMYDVLTGPSEQWIRGSDPVILLAVGLFMAGLGFKIAIVPFHMWAPDVYEGAPTPVSGLLAAASKKMGFAALFKVFLVGIIVSKVDWEEAAAVLAIITMTVGNLIAVSQTNIKRMLAYSSIAQAGYILIVLPVSTQYAVAGGLFHILTHAFMKSGAFMVVASMGAVAIGEKLDDFKGLSRRSPLLALSMTLFLFSLAGIPPLAGFASKFVLFSSAVYASFTPGAEWLVWLAVAGVLNSALSLYYYARVVKHMYMDKGPEGRIVLTPMVKFAIGIAVVMVVAIGVYPDAVVNLCKEAAAAAFPNLPAGLG
ncbi:MAG: NADH-quinone oxidoreductase subunit N [Thermoplasmata archaeon]